MYTYGEIFNCENCQKELVRGSAEDNMTELCNECLEQAQISTEMESLDIEEAF